MSASRSITSQQKKMLILSSLGGMLEFYDFIIYIFFAPVIEKLFFADSSSYMATLKTLAIFSIGYLLRPLGGIIFSHFGDRYGRKIVFLTTVIFMAVPSFAIGLLPTSASIGGAAPILLLFFRMMQGLALGGEIPAAITFVSEHVPGQRRAFSLSTLFFGINLGLLLGSFITTLLTSLLTEAQLFAYGYRIPFILGGVFGLISLFLRRHLHETSAFTSLRQTDLQRVPVAALLRHSRMQVLQGMLLVGTGSVTVFLYLYWPQYLHQYMNYDYAALMKINTVGTLTLTLTILLGGLMADKWGYRNMYLLSTTLLVLLTYPLFMLLNLQNIAWVILSYMMFSLIFGFIPGSYSAILSGLFPTSVRYSGIAMSYNMAFALFGGLSPVICTYIIHAFNSVLAPAWYVTTMAFLSLIACYAGRRTDKNISPATLHPGIEKTMLTPATEPSV